jgi:hemolysin activation/secretion protein
MKITFPIKPLHLLLAGLAWHPCLVGAQEVPRFPIVRFNIEGNTLLPQAAVNAAVQPFIGPRRDFGDVQRALEALEELYKQRGYTTVGVSLPEQVLEKGEVLLKVTEGRIRDLKIDGQLHFDADNIRASLPTLKPGEPPLIDDVSANLRIANENPAKKVELRLQPGERDEDIDAHLKVTDESPLKLGAVLENTGTEQTGKRRLGLSFQHANLWNRDHILTAQYQTSPEKPGDVKVYALAYRVPLYGLGDAIDFFATKSNVNAGSIAAGPINLAISGSGVVYGGRYTLNLKRRGDYEQQLVFGIDHKAFENNIGGGGLQLGNDITVHPLSFQYNGRWAKDSSEVSVFGSVVRNLPGGDKGSQADFNKARAGAPDDFSVLRAGLTLSHAYASDWQVRLVSSGQWTDRPLIPGEQFGIGGASSVRGFEEREIANDRGYQASFELYTPELCKDFPGEQRCRLLAFVDGGSVYRLRALAGEQEQEHVASTGLGLRYSWGKNFAFQSDFGHVLQGGGSQQRGDWRVHARIGVFF